MLNGRYANYTTDTTNIAQGASVAMRVTNGFPYTLDHFGMWVDWNNNGNFLDDPAVTVTGITGGGLYSAAITCQVGVSEGSKRMRFRIHYDGEATSPCGTAIWEEVEDYTIIVTGSVWTGAVNTNWDKGGNWNPAVVPGATRNVIIPAIVILPVSMRFRVCQQLVTTC